LNFSEIFTPQYLNVLRKSDNFGTNFNSSDVLSFINGSDAVSQIF